MCVCPAPIRLLIVDDSRETCDILESYFALVEEVTVCCVAHDGEEALYCIGQHQPDVVLLDLIMPKTDGLAVLERLQRAVSTGELSVRPRVIVTSAVGQEKFTSTALSLGADYYMIKPYNLSDLLSRISTITCADTPPAPEKSTVHHVDDAQAAVARGLLELGLPAHMRGYRYCCSAVLLLMRENKPQAIVKDVYRIVAQANDTTAECVESALRTVIQSAFSTSPQAMHGLTGCGQKKPPANGKFLMLFTQHMLLNQNPETRGEHRNVVP